MASLISCISSSSGDISIMGYQLDALLVISNSNLNTHGVSTIALELPVHLS